MTKIKFCGVLFLVVVTLIAPNGAIFFLNPPDLAVARYSFLFFSQRAYAAEKPEFMLFGGYIPLEAGKYKVTYALKVDNNKLDEPVAIIDVVVNEARDQLACVTLAGTNFTSSNVYQDFDLIFNSSGRKDFEFRVQHYGNCDLWVDKVTLARLGRGGEWKFFERIEAESPNIFHNVGESVSDQEDASGGKAWKASKRLTETEILHPVLEIRAPKLKLPEISKSLLVGFLIGFLLIVLVCAIAYQMVVRIRKPERSKRKRWSPQIPKILRKSKPVTAKLLGVALSSFRLIPQKSKLVIVLLSLILLSAFFGSLSISKFVLWIEYLILLYFLLSLIWKVDSRVSIAAALFFLVCCPFLLIFKCDLLAERMAIYAYYFLVVGVVLQLIEYMRKRVPEEERVLAEEVPVEIGPSPQIGLGEAPGVTVVEKAQVDYLSPRYRKTRMALRREQRRRRRKRLLALGLVSVALLGALFLAPGLGLLERSSDKTASESVTETQQPEVMKAPVELGSKTTAPTIDRSKVTIQVLNGNGIKGEATRISTVLGEGGFNVLTPRDADRDDYPKTIIRYKQGVEDAANLVVREIRDIYPASLKGDLPSDSATDILVILGRNRIE